MKEDVQPDSERSPLTLAGQLAQAEGMVKQETIPSVKKHRDTGGDDSLEWSA